MTQVRLRKRSVWLSVVWLLGFGLSPTVAAAQRLTLAQLDSALRAEAKPVLLYLHADWCTYCTALEQQTLSDPEVRALLASAVHFVGFDTESSEDQVFAGRSYVARSRGRRRRQHQLVDALTPPGGSLSLPALVLLDPQLRVRGLHQGFLSAAELKAALEKLAAAGG